MNPTLYNVGGVELSPPEIRVFIQMLENTDHTFTFAEEESDLTRQCLDILVLEGLIERFQAADGSWLDVWVITDDGIAWVQEPDVSADIQLSKALSTLVA